MSTCTIHKILIAVGLSLILCSQAFADEYDSEPYPIEFVARPLLLHDGMMQVRVGAASDFVSADSADRLDTQTDFLVAFAPRLQFGVVSVLAAVPTDGFAVGDLSAHFEYSALPALDIRLGGYFAAPRDENDELDGRYGVRAGLPMKWRTSDGTAIWFTPELSVGTQDDRRLDAPIVGQLQLGSHLALSATTGLRLAELDFTEEAASMPLAGGLHIAMTRMVDVNVSIGMTDVTESAGRDDRWLLGSLSFRN